MSRHEDMVRLHHMLDHAKEAVELMQDKGRPDLEGSRVLQLALVRLIEIVGEAAGRVSKKKQRELSNIPWAEIIGMRNRLIHGYDFLDLDILWQTVDEDLPILIAKLEKIVSPEDLQQQEYSAGPR
jgi:uncharacterized protein with HEPN domain